MHRCYFFHAFDFYHSLTLYYYIHSISTIKLYPLILQGQQFLPFESDTLKIQFMTIAFFISRLQQPRPKMPMNFDSTGDQFFC